MEKGSLEWDENDFKVDDKDKIFAKNPILAKEITQKFNKKPTEKITKTTPKRAKKQPKNTLSPAKKPKHDQQAKEGKCRLIVHKDLNYSIKEPYNFAIVLTEIQPLEYEFYYPDIPASSNLYGISAQYPRLIRTLDYIQFFTINRVKVGDSVKNGNEDRVHKVPAHWISDYEDFLGTMHYGRVTMLYQGYEVRM